MSNIYKNYNPDILETIANLSNDEVFTPPKLANEILDLLPEEVWSNPNLTFLDPAVKTGIFLREITSRLIDGLADQIPDLQERVNHILTKQVFGIGITELTTLMARRTVYCSMTANGPYSICTEFDDEKGNIIFPDTEHTWDKNGRCEICGANERNYSGGENEENYAYPFIHDNFEKEFGNMKFDVIIGNPPYQLSAGNDGRNSGFASAIYHLFIERAMELNPKYICMITPSRWMTRTAGGVPKSWIDNMIYSNSIKEIHDYQNANDVFDRVVIQGGVSYFLWENAYKGKCKYNYYPENENSLYRYDFLDPLKTGVVVRNPKYLSILTKVAKYNEDKHFYSNDNNFSSLVSPSHFFDNYNVLSTSWRGYSSKRSDENDIKCFVSKHSNGVDYGWMNFNDIPKNTEVVNMHKLYISGTGGIPIYGPPKSVCSQSYLVIGYDYKKHNFTKAQCFNIISYSKTMLFNFLLKIKKIDQGSARAVYQFIPLQDWNKPWTDEELYKKYKLTQEEIDYIEENVDPMSASDD